MNIEEKLSTAVSKECDVLVCGGGFAGIAAALAAARENKNVILLDRGFMLGGLGTAGLITGYLPICDGFGHQVSFGIAEELLRLSISFGCERPRATNWLDSNDPAQRTENDPRFDAWFNPHFCAILCEQLLMKNGVKLLYGTYAVATDVNDGRINAVIVENKSGRSAIKVKSVVDATGDADIALFAGVPCETFRQGNILAAWYYAFNSEKGYFCKPLGVCDIPDEQKKAGGGEVPMLMNRRFTGLDADEITDFVTLSHDSVMNDIITQRENDASFVPATLASIPELRMTRKLVGEYSLDDKEDHKYFEDSVGMVSDWRKRGPVYEVPFRTLYSAKCKNLVCAGRCTSVTEPMWDIMRVIPCCSVTGQAAGTAAAMCNDFTALNVKTLQKKLEENGVVLHWDDLKK